MFRFNRANSGNLAREFAAPLPHTNTPPTRNMTYDDDNRLLTVNGNSVVNDLDGNLTSGPLTNGIFASYAYDARNRLQNVGGVTNTYDPAGNKIGITYGTNSVSYQWARTEKGLRIDIGPGIDMNAFFAEQEKKGFKVERRPDGTVVVSHPKRKI